MPAINRKNLSTDQIAGAREYVRIEQKGERACFAERLRSLLILFSTGIPHVDLIRIGRMRSSH